MRESSLATDLAAAARGSREATDRLIPLVYDHLRGIAKQAMLGEGGAHTLQTTALVHEAYLRLVELKHVEWSDETHLLAFASTVIRRILVDHARARNTAKRGAGWEQVTLNERAGWSGPRTLDILVLEEAMQRLTQLSPRQARVAELRFFAGLTIAQAARVLGAATSTVESDWALARAWLTRELERRS